MDHLEFDFVGHGNPPRRSHALVGVVGSGNLEVLLERAELAGNCQAVVDTSIRGFDTLWQRVLTDFVNRHGLADVRISVNDGGATPAVVTLRLDQAAAEIKEDRL
ncbi:malonate decarboxylase delta subunit [Natronocella acetinitrilica]|uniref:Malonate decarboxylase acyl carrier protein n=1 Tax=Natronocella acetinitrilica TaxID=414046 RepID=A0AAE3G0W3_9GAMM|nr:malonate decarboxylase acyl carrier protein [Natronocella acetinitrilica]MCP1673419.1 malonate decarboxylase delta subunit [Natronocella acetinitrilica]